MFRRGLRELLESHNGWEVCGEAVDGIDAIQKNRLLSPDLVITDFAMPRMTGLEASSEILKESPKRPILLISLFATHELAQQAQETGISATLSKAETDSLVPCIEALVGRKKA